MTNPIDALKLTHIDVWLIFLSPICSILGSLAHMCLIEINPNKMPGRGHTHVVCFIDAMGRFKWIVYRLFVGAVLGLLFAFYFVGAIAENATTLFKLLAFAILVGYSAPRLWFMQEKILMEQIDSKIRTAIDNAVPLSIRREAQQPAAVHCDTPATTNT